MAREYRGGYYKMDHVSFGAMMVSEQLRPALRAVSTAIALRARLNAIERSGVPEGEEVDRDTKRLAKEYKPEEGPIVVVTGQGGEPGPRITHRVVNRLRYAAADEFGRGGHTKGKGSRNLRRAGAMFGDLWGED